MGRGESKNSDISVMRVCGEPDDDPNTHHHKYKNNTDRRMMGGSVWHQEVQVDVGVEMGVRGC